MQTLQQQKLHPNIISHNYNNKTKHYPLLINQNTTTKQTNNKPILITLPNHHPLTIHPKLPISTL
ncbi:tetraacyldisaccharide 4'-kinase, partial [Enterococcus hirae]